MTTRTMVKKAKFLPLALLVLVVSLALVDSASKKTQKAVDKSLESVSKFVGYLADLAYAVLLGLFRAFGLAGKDDKESESKQEEILDGPEPDLQDNEDGPSLSRIAGLSNQVTIERSVPGKNDEATPGVAEEEDVQVQCIPWKVSGCKPGPGGDPGTGCCDNGPNRPRLECRSSPDGKDAACAKECLEAGDKCPFTMENGGCCGSKDGLEQLRCLDDLGAEKPGDRLIFGRCGTAEVVSTTPISVHAD